MSHDIANLRRFKALARQDYEKQLQQASGAGSSDYGDAGPPWWSRPAWDAFKNQYGFYPYGMQNGTMVYPPSFAGAPDWVYALMGLRKPPVTVTPENA